MSKRLEIVILLGLIAFFVFIAVVSHREGVDKSQANPLAVQRSTYRTMPEGYKALYLALRDLGYPVQRQTRAYNLLPQDGGLLVIADPPPEREQVEMGQPINRSIAKKEGDELLAWLRQGNHALILTEFHSDVLPALLGSRTNFDPEQQMLEAEQLDESWLTAVSSTEPDPDAPGTQTPKRPDNWTPLGPPDIPLEHTLAKPVTPSFLGERAPKLEVYAFRRFNDTIPLDHRQIERLGSVVPLYRDDAGVVAAYSRVGDGGIIWCCSPWSFSNGGIDAGDNLEFVRAIADLKPGAPVIFDEYHQGFGNQTTVWQLLPKIAKIGILQLVGALLLLFAVLAWRFGPAQLPAEERFSRSRAEYLTAMAALLERARATHVVRERLDVLLRRELGRRLGVSPTAPTARILQANAGHAVVDQAQLERVLSQLEHMTHQKRPDPDALLRLSGEIQRMLHAKT